ncbi:beta-lactamase/transpeptidase-like protein [Corynascus novoguineensis]|uniref:Beta-lactamase/transpeptidase-like protein n=1 Tax=Corynascus novoguineensis TaxID=1126955 RepID=A0AAN7CMG0_9PEZI|nr:beta-lactamase/transpeptidase-like protein [Corynascus novoguineensis]
MADALLASLDATKYRIGRIRHAFGTPSVACGILHQGQVIFRHAEGYADVEARRQADADTVYPVSSCTKAFVSATCAILADQGLLSWDTPISLYLPEFQTVHNEEVGRQATLVDLCSHATGLAPMDHAAVGFHGKLHNEGSNQVRISAHLPMVCGFRSGFVYNNYMYGVVGELIRKVCDKSVGAVMKERIFEPLGLGRTGTSLAEYPLDGNVAKGYSVLDDGSPLPLDESEVQDGSVHAGAGCVRSTVNDMLEWARAVMEAESRQSRTGAGIPNQEEHLPGLAFTRRAQRPITPGARTTQGEDQYGLGWFRHTMPSRLLGFTSPNFSLLPEPPVIGKESPPRLTICHHGAQDGFLTAFYTFPETRSAIVVLANSSPSRGDPTDLIAQTLCQELFDMSPRVDLEAFAFQCAKTSGLIWPALVQDWVLSRGEKTVAPIPEDYSGEYTNVGLGLHIHVVFVGQPFRKTRRKTWKSQNPELLTFSVNGGPVQKLRHYQGDTWSFLPNSRDDAARKGMERFTALSNFLLVFVRGISGRISGLEWDLYAGAADERPAPDAIRVSPVRFDKIV